MSDMKRRTHFPMARAIVQFATVLGIDPQRVVRRAGLPRDFLTDEGRGATPDQAYAVWRAAEAECDRPDLALFLARTFAHMPFTPAMLAFSCSPDVRTGLRRLSVFKPLMGPLRFQVAEDDEGLVVVMSGVTETLELPPLMGVFEALFLLEATRNYTAAHIVPLEIGLPTAQSLRREDVDFIGAAPRLAPRPYLRFSASDARLPLVTENAEVWPDFERRMRARLAELDSDTPMTQRARATLLDMLPGGEASIEALCRRLHVSKRSLQRHLREEGESFKSVLAATRAELAMNYLSHGGLSVEEIAHLLAYREPNSFYRAFQGWTGMTPAEARGLNLQ